MQSSLIKNALKVRKLQATDKGSNGIRYAAQRVSRKTIFPFLTMRPIPLFRAALFAVIGTYASFVVPSNVFAQSQVCPVLPPPVSPRMNLIEQNQPAVAEQPLATQYDCGHPTNEEQYYLELLNRARMNPPAAGVEISNTTDPDVSFEFTYWAGQDPNEPTRASIKTDFATYVPKQPLAMNASLLTAARVHSQDMIDNNYQGHQGTDGSWPSDRAQKAGYPGLFGGPPYVGENAAAYAKSVYDAYAGWLIDFGSTNDTQWGHRNNCLEFKSGSDTVNPGYTECGPGMIPYPQGSYPTHTGPLVCTLDLGDAGKHFILGVAYSDNNHNNFYDIGEGDSGVKITVSSGSYYAITSGSGGYAIPFSGSGSVTVTASGGPFPTPVTKTIDFEGQNVKVDFNPDLTGYPTQAILVLPSIDTTVNFDSVTFTWNSVQLATKYHIEIGTDSLFKKGIVANDSVLTDTTFKFGVLKDSTTYFWRVQAKNTKGTGPWSEAAAFSVGLAPSTVALISPANNAVVADSDVTFLWHVGNKGTQSYAIAVTSDKAMKDTVFSDLLQSDMNDTSDVAPASTFQAGQTYYWTVAAYNDFGWGMPGAPNHFAFASSSVGSESISQSAVTISPNPTTGALHLHFTSRTASEGELQMFNSLGEEVERVNFGALAPAEHEYVLDLSALPAGSYTYRLRMGTAAKIGAIIVVH